eukprot:TRINITY_DN4972_c0_g1_i1.p1 TRINITY_DN4972_c0_g1~~TRINITY_DN4972_c0_g1_i1.p1  ORF type:complete len:142 (-),score=10.37 TRINITY_DN4972_c0_g1_i1:206-571(-)
MAACRMLAALFVAFAYLSACDARKVPMTGAPFPVANPEADAEVVAATTFAITEHNKSVLEGRKLKLVRILSATAQVVAGLNYNIKFYARPIQHPTYHPNLFRVEVFAGLDHTMQLTLFKQF